MEARAFLWIIQCIQTYSEDYCFTIFKSLDKPHRSLHIPTQLFHSMFAPCIKYFNIANQGSAVVLSSLCLPRL